MVPGGATRGKHLEAVSRELFYLIIFIKRNVCKLKQVYLLEMSLNFTVTDKKLGVGNNSSST